MDLYAGLISRNPVSTIDFKAKIALITHFGGETPRNLGSGLNSVTSKECLFHAYSTNRGINNSKLPEFTNPISQDGIYLVSHSRLDNRHELIEELGYRYNSRKFLPDQMIILYAWMKWGSECVHKLRGDWSFVIHDSNTGTTYLAVDYIASYQIYYAVEDGQILFSNHLKAAVQLKVEAVSIDEKFLFNRLMIHRNRKPETGMENVCKVAPGHLITITKDLQITKKRYWFPDHLTKLDTSNDDEIIEEFLRVYETAVRRRILPGHKIGSHLSGGLDSGSVSWLASKVLKEEGRPLVGLTGTEYFDTSSTHNGRGNEEQYAQITADATGHIEQHSFRCEGVSMIESIRNEVSRSLNLSHGVGNLFWIHAISEFAKQCGLDTILVGQVGNASVTWAGISGKSLVKKDVIKLINTIKMKLLVRNKDVLELDDYPFTFFDPGTKAILNTDFQKRHTLKELQKSNKDAIDDHCPSWVHPDRLILLNFHAAGIGSFWEMMSIDFGLYHWDPTADQDVVEFCLRLPESYYAKNGGRNLVRRAFDGKIPKEVLFKKLKGRQSSDWMIRFSHEIPQFEALMDSIPGDHPVRSYIDIEAFRKLVLEWEKEYRMNGSHGPAILSGTISRVLGLYFLLEGVGSGE